MRSRKLLFQALGVVVLGAVALLQPRTAAASDPIDGCVWCDPIEHCESDSTLQGRCTANGCGPLIGCGVFGTTCTGVMVWCSK